jgi:hypothetical protein
MRSIVTALLSVGFVFGSINIGFSDSTSTHTQRMESHGYHRYQGSWKTEQEILLLKKAETITKKKGRSQTAA